MVKSILAVFRVSMSGDHDPEVHEQAVKKARAYRQSFFPGATDEQTVAATMDDD